MIIITGKQAGIVCLYLQDHTNRWTDLVQLKIMLIDTLGTHVLVMGNYLLNVISFQKIVFLPPPREGFKRKDAPESFELQCD